MTKYIITTNGINSLSSFLEAEKGTSSVCRSLEPTLDLAKAWAQDAQTDQHRAEHTWQVRYVPDK